MVAAEIVTGAFEVLATGARVTVEAISAGCFAGVLA